jgi:uracil-DNA glycosylase
VDGSWQGLVQAFWRTDEGKSLQAFLSERLAGGATIFPVQPLRALSLTPLAQVRVVILGQDPYHGIGQAEGLSFSVQQGVAIPPSLRNIFKELRADVGLQPPMSGSLVYWAKRGVLLLNTCLTVEEGLPASHAGKGWELLTDNIISAVAQQAQPLVFMLWGAHAQSKRPLIESAIAEQKLTLPAAHPVSAAHQVGAKQLLLQANHPSPLSALRGPAPFMGCRHFSMAQSWLSQCGIPFSWDFE